MNYLRNTLLLLSFVFSISLSAKDTPNSRQARRIFNEVYEKTFGNEGSTLHYAVNNNLGSYKELKKLLFLRIKY